MKRAALALIGAMICGATAAPAAEFDSRYTRANDRKSCRYTHSAASSEGPESCEFRCDGPASGVSTRLLSCHDYEHLYFRVDGRWFSTWAAMTAVGGMSGLGHKQGLVEWLFEPGAPTLARERLVGMIVRFQGVDAEGRSHSALAAFSLRPERICWKGNFATNELARAAVATPACETALTPEKE